MASMSGPLSLLPAELQRHVLKYLGRSDKRVLRRVCRNLGDVVDEVINSIHLDQLDSQPLLRNGQPRFANITTISIALPAGTQDLDQQLLQLAHQGLSQLPSLSSLTFKPPGRVSRYNIQGLVACCTLLEELKFPGAGANVLQPLRALKHLTKLVVDACGAPLDLAPLAQMQQLQVLQLEGHGCPNANITASTLQPLTSLIRLKLGKTFQLEGNAALQLASLVQLTYLYSPSLVLVGPSLAILDLPNLQVLGAAFIAPVEVGSDKGQHLTELWLGGLTDRWGDLIINQSMTDQLEQQHLLDSCLQGLLPLPALQSLDATMSYDSCVHLLEDLGEGVWQQDDEDVDDEGWDDVEAMEQGQLVSLGIHVEDGSGGSDDFEKVPAEYVAPVLEQQSGLQKLSLCGATLDEDCFEMISVMTALTHLHLKYCNLQKGLQGFALLHGCAALADVELHDCMGLKSFEGVGALLLGKPGMKRLRMHDHGLNYYEIRSRMVTEGGLNALKAMAHGMGIEYSVEW